MQEIEDRAKKRATEGKKQIKDAWVDTKATAEKAKNEVESKVDQM